MSFSNQEYKTRLKKVKKSMQDKGIDLLISHDTANMYTLQDMMLGLFIMLMCFSTYRFR